MYETLAPDEIEPGLWLGRAPQSPEDFAALRDLGVQDLVTLQTEDEARSGGVHPTVAFRLAAMMGLVLHRCPIVDFNAASLRNGARPAAETLAALRGRGRRVYVHCRAGINRSPTIVACYLALARGLSPADACAEVLRLHPEGMPEEDVVRLVAKRPIRRPM